MRLYRVGNIQGQKPRRKLRDKFAGTQADARRVRMALMKKYDLRRKEIAIDVIEVPSRKADMVGWLNELKLRRG